MTKGRTNKPCPACGKTSEFGRPTGGICVECQRLLDDGKAYRQMIASNADTLLPFKIPSGHGTLPYIHHGGDSFSPDDPRKLFQQRYLEVVQAMSVRESAENSCHLAGVTELPTQSRTGGSRWESYGVRVLLTYQAAATLDGLYDAARKMVSYAYDLGKRDGRRFITELVSGEVSLAQLQNVEDDSR